MDTGTTLYLLLGFLAIAGTVWLLCAAFAWSTYRTFRQRADLYWLAAFGLLALGSLSRALQAFRWLPENAEVIGEAAELANRLWSYQMRVGAFDMLAAFLVFYAFRARRELD